MHKRCFQGFIGYGMIVSMQDTYGVVKSISDKNHALVVLKGRKGSPGRIGSPRRKDSHEREASLEPRWRKDLSKIICFECHEFGNYASQCPHRRGRGRR
jgi:hypothetical protein